jgi:ABC-type anion transport system duplicated permease subunit
LFDILFSFPYVFCSCSFPSPFLFPFLFLFAFLFSIFVYPSFCISPLCRIGHPQKSWMLKSTIFNRLSCKCWQFLAFLFIKILINDWWRKHNHENKTIRRYIKENLRLLTKRSDIV